MQVDAPAGCGEPFALGTLLLKAAIEWFWSVKKNVSSNKSLSDTADIHQYVGLCQYDMLPMH